MTDKIKILHLRRRAALGICAALLAAQLSASAQTLVHRYSFSETDDGAGDIGATVHDSVGNANGALPLGGTFTGAQLQLQGGLQEYVNLPAGILSNYTAVSFEAWVTVGVDAEWNSALFAFGNTDASGAGEDYIHCNAQVGRICISTNDAGWQGTGEINAYSGLSWNGLTIHVTGVVDPTAGYIAIYTNGVLAGINHAETYPLSGVVDQINYLNRSLYTGDLYYDCAWDEFRVWNGALNPLQVAGSDASGQDTVSTDAGAVTSVQLQLPYYQMTQGNHQQAQVFAQASKLNYPVDIASMATYLSGNTNILTVDSNGVISAVGQGATTIAAKYGSLSSTQTVSSVQPASTLVNRYSFSDKDDGAGNIGATVHDAVGGAAGAGTLVNGGTFTGSQLVLASTNTQYISLPPGILSNYSAITIDAWASTPSTLPTYSFFYGFGNTDASGRGEDYLFGSIARGYAAVTAVDPGYNGEQGASGASLSGIANLHFTAVYNPPGGFIAIYSNGVLYAKNTAVTDPLSTVQDVYSFIGKSLYNGDPYPDISLDEFRIFNGALTSQGVALSDQGGPNALLSGVTNGPGALESLSFEIPSTLEWLQAGSLKLLANYASLTNFDLVGNSVFPPAGLTITSSDPSVVSYGSDNKLHALKPGAAHITGVYQGVTNTALITVVHASPAVLTHRYSFTTDASDSVGGAAWAGTLVGSASVSGGQLLIPNVASTSPALDYLVLPAGILTNAVNGIGTNFNDPAVTVEAWATVYPGQYTWANLFDFGTQDASNLSAYDIHVAVHANPSDTIIGISDSDDANGHYQYWDGGSGSALDGSTNLHLVAVFNPPAGYMALYTNGVLMGANSLVTISMAGVSAVLNKIGADNWPDAGMQGSVDEFRIYNGVLSPDDVAANYALGPDTLPTPKVTLAVSASGGNMILSWPATATATLQSRTSLNSGAWAAVTSPAPQKVGAQWQVTLPKTGLAQFFRLVH